MAALRIIMDVPAENEYPGTQDSIPLILMSWHVQ